MNTNNIVRNINSMEIWLASLPVTPGHVLHGVRPVIIVSDSNNRGQTVTVVPITSNLKTASMPTHVCLRGYGLTTTSIAKCEHVTSIDKACLIRRMGEISAWYDRLAIHHGLAIHFDINPQVSLAS